MEYDGVVKRRRILWIAGVVGVAAAASALLWPREREPVYQGKKLSEWVRVYSETLGHVGSSPTARREHVAAVTAIRQMGTNALPWMVRWIAYEPPGWRRRSEGLLFRLPPRVARRFWQGDLLANNAEWSFGALGPEAKAAAVAELTRLVLDPRRPPGCERAMGALRRIGREGFPPLLRVLEERGAGHSKAFGEILAMGEAGIDISAAIPALLLKDRDIRNDARAAPNVDFIYAWSCLAGDPQSFTSELTNCLHHTNSEVRAEAAGALGRLRSRAAPAVSALVEALGDSSPAVRVAATNALSEIASELSGVSQHEK